jgi:hypothetical protein
MATEPQKSILNYATRPNASRRLRPVRFTAGLLCYGLAIIGAAIGYANRSSLFPIVPDPVSPTFLAKEQERSKLVYGDCCTSPLLVIAGTVLIVSAFKSGGPGAE